MHDLLPPSGEGVVDPALVQPSYSCLRQQRIETEAVVGEVRGVLPNRRLRQVESRHHDRVRRPVGRVTQVVRQRDLHAYLAKAQRREKARILHVVGRQLGVDDERRVALADRLQVLSERRRVDLVDPVEGQVERLGVER
jgi:hypothetical protein